MQNSQFPDYIRKPCTYTLSTYIAWRSFWIQRIAFTFLLSWVMLHDLFNFTWVIFTKIFHSFRLKFISIFLAFEVKCKTQSATPNAYFMYIHSYICWLLTTKQSFFHIFFWIQYILTFQSSGVRIFLLPNGSKNETLMSWLAHRI